MENAGNNQRLTSWKEIANYLGRDIRTCWRWEKVLGLLIHRADRESPKSRVYAFKDELDDWLRREKAGQNDSKGLRHTTFWRTAIYFLAPALGAIAILIVLAIKRGQGSKSPADFQIKGTSERYLDCGNPRCGFARIRCPDCHTEHLLMFSCRTRGFCPSCHAKRLEEWGEWMRETLILDVPHRKVVFTIPRMLRIFFKYNRRHPAYAPLRPDPRFQDLVGRMQLPEMR